MESKHPWWALHRPRDPQIFTSPKFIGLTTSKTIQLIYDASASLYVTDAMYVFHTTPEHDPLVVMAILQSKLFLYLYHTANQGESRVIPQVKASKLDSLPYPLYSSSHVDLGRLILHSKDMFELHRQLAKAQTAYDRSALQRQIDATDQQINQLVYQLYGLTDEEIKLVEEENS